MIGVDAVSGSLTLRVDPLFVGIRVQADPGTVFGTELESRKFELDVGDTEDYAEEGVLLGESDEDAVVTLSLGSLISPKVLRC